MALKPTRPKVSLAISPDEPIYPCHTGSGSVTGCPEASRRCDSGLGYGVYTYQSGILMLDDYSKCSGSDSSLCHANFEVTGPERKWLDLIYSFDPDRKYFCCCASSSVGGSMSVSVEGTLPKGIDLCDLAAAFNKLCEGADEPKKPKRDGKGKSRKKR